jgi:hypothetical protein
MYSTTTTPGMINQNMIFDMSLNDHHGFLNISDNHLLNIDSNMNGHYDIYTGQYINSNFVIFRNVSVNVSGNIQYYITINGNAVYTRSLLIKPSCFNEGTKILCLNNQFQDEYIPIQNLRKGNMVKTYKHGYRKIELIGKNPMFNNTNIWYACMFKMTKSETNNLIDDLIVTGGHSVLVDDLGDYKDENDKLFFGSTPMIDDKYLLLCGISKDFVKINNNNLFTYYHFILENNGNDDERFGVWANGILTETPSKNLFMNHKYILL